MREIYFGGTEEFGGYFFSLVHMPSSLVLAYVFQFMEISGHVADFIFVLLAVVCQTVLLGAIVYVIESLWISKPEK